MTDIRCSTKMSAGRTVFEVSQITFSYCSSTVFDSSFFRSRTTSSTFLLDTISMAMLKAFLRTSRSGLERARRISIVKSSRMPSFRCLS